MPGLLRRDVAQSGRAAGRHALTSTGPGIPGDGEADPPCQPSVCWRHLTGRPARCPAPPVGAHPAATVAVRRRPRSALGRRLERVTPHRAAGSAGPQLLRSDEPSGQRWRPRVGKPPDTVRTLDRASATAGPARRWWFQLLVQPVQAEQGRVVRRQVLLGELVGGHVQCGPCRGQLSPADERGGLGELGLPPGACRRRSAGARGRAPRGLVEQRPLASKVPQRPVNGAASALTVSPRGPAGEQELHAQ